MPLPTNQRSGRYSVVIFDVDGTLVDSNDAHARAWIDAFAEEGVDVPFERVRRAIGMGGDKLLPHVSGIQEESPRGAAISRRRGEIFRERYLPGVTAFPRVRDLLARLAADGYRIVVASSAKDEELQPLLERAQVADLVQSSTSSDDAEHSKPEPDIVQAALKRAEAGSDAAVMIGDTPYDVESATRAGVAVIGVESGGWTSADLKGAAEVYESAGALLDKYADSVLGRHARERRERDDEPHSAGGR